MMKMKKYSILVAAFAVLAFVGCKKDNNGSLVADQNGMITLEMSGETHQDNGKQSFFGTANRIFFNEGDQMIVNGSVCNVTPQAVAGDELATEFQSYKAKVAILAEYAYTPLYAMYPAEAFTLGTAADYSDMTVEMFNNVDLFTVADAAVTLGSATYYQPWPMTAYLENLNTPRIQLKNNIALVTPSVKFGYPFVNQFVQDNNLNVTVDPNTRTFMVTMVTSKVLTPKSPNWYSPAPPLLLVLLLAGFLLIVVMASSLPVLLNGCSVMLQFLLWLLANTLKWTFTSACNLEMLLLSIASTKVMRSFSPTTVLSDVAVVPLSSATCSMPTLIIKLAFNNRSQFYESRIG